MENIKAKVDSHDHQTSTVTEFYKFILVPKWVLGPQVCFTAEQYPPKIISFNPKNHSYLLLLLFDHFLHQPLTKILIKSQLMKAINSVFIVQVLFIRNQLSPRRSLPTQSLCESEYKTLQPSSKSQRLFFKCFVKLKLSYSSVCNHDV